WPSCSTPPRTSSTPPVPRSWPSSRSRTPKRRRTGARSCGGRAGAAEGAPGGEPKATPRGAPGLRGPNGTMKVRVGFGLGTQGLGGDPPFATVVGELGGVEFGLVGLAERITGGAVDPVVGCAFAAGRTERLKFGFSVMVLPGRNPVL